MSCNELFLDRDLDVGQKHGELQQLFSHWKKVLFLRVMTACFNMTYKRKTSSRKEDDYHTLANVPLVGMYITEIKNLDAAAKKGAERKSDADTDIFYCCIFLLPS